MTRCYLDSSALAKLGTVEPETVVLRQHLEEYHDRFTSRLSAVEVSRALARKGSGAGAAAVELDALLEGIAMIELDEAVARLAAHIEPSTLRSLDAIHLASALSIREDLDAFISYDARLADAARSLGLSVVAPG